MRVGCPVTEAQARVAGSGPRRSTIDGANTNLEDGGNLLSLFTPSVDDCYIDISLLIDNVKKFTISIDQEGITEKMWLVQKLTSSRARCHHEHHIRLSEKKMIWEIHVAESAIKNPVLGKSTSTSLKVLH